MVHVKELLTLGSVWLLQAVAVTPAVQLRESPVISYLRETSDPDVIPVPDSSDGPLQVSISLDLNILDVDRERNEIEFFVWQATDWTNPALTWNVSREGFNLTDVVLPSKYLWLPDIAVLNAVSSLEIPTTSFTNLLNTGFIITTSKIRVRVGCQLQGIDSSSGANCSLKLGSWTHSRKSMTLLHRGGFFAKFPYGPTPDYNVVTTLSTTAMTKPCCPGEEFEVAEYHFVITSRDQAEPDSE